MRPEHSLIAALRKNRDEAQITQALAAVLACDERMAAQFLRLVIAKCSRSHAGEVSRRVPALLRCTAEESVAADGRVDLAFRSSEGAWSAYVELKVHSPYGDRQIERYVGAALKRGVSVVAAITRNVPSGGEDIEEQEWVGSTRWGHILEDLRLLGPANAALKLQWSLFLDVLEDEGAMGYTGANPNLLAAWAMSPHARDHAESFVDAVRQDVLDALGEVLARAGMAPEAAAAASLFQRGKHGHRVVLPKRGKMQVALRVPNGGPVRVKAGLWGWGDLRFAVEIVHPLTIKNRDLTVKLAEQGYVGWNDQLMERFLPLAPDNLEDPSLPEHIREFCVESFQALVRSGYFETGLTYNDAPGDLSNEE